MATTRRQFLSFTFGGSALISLAPSFPKFLLAATQQQSTSHSDNVLVVVQLTGGNDGLNTVIPYADELYRRNRPTLAIAEPAVLKIDSALGFHPSLRGFADLLEAGKLAIVQGVGYPNPNRSHFESMDIWHTASPQPGNRPTGWLGRALDAEAQRDGRDVPALHLGAEPQPLAFASRDVPALSVQSLDRFKLELASDEQVRAAVKAAAAAERQGENPLLDFVQQSTTAALDASQRLEQAQSQPSKASYPNTELAQKLRTIAQLIKSGMNTRIYYLSLDGFDTHSNQAAAHSGLLSQWSDAIKSFVDDLAEQGHADRVLVASFSEFGRRVKENASRGTDHGAAAPMFLAGGRVKPGLCGDHPSLSDLDDGDQKHHTDFRQVYATILEQWMGWKSAPALGGDFKTIPVFAG